ncbi:MAG: hypothetical protein OXD29_02625, partial [Roseovarius sp.]|nr:hypothetical protein [Roseovarius sp.]
MNDDRTVSADAIRARMTPPVSGKKSDRGVTARDNRLSVEGVLRRVRTGCPWRDLAGMPDLLGGLEFGALIGDRAFDADWPAGEVERRGAGMRHGGDAIEAQPFGASGPR